MPPETFEVSPPVDCNPLLFFRFQNSVPYEPGHHLVCLTALKEADQHERVRNGLKKGPQRTGSCSGCRTFITMIRQLQGKPTPRAQSGRALPTRTGPFQDVYNVRTFNGTKPREQKSDQNSSDHRTSFPPTVNLILRSLQDLNQAPGHEGRSICPPSSRSIKAMLSSSISTGKALKTAARSICLYLLKR